MTRQIIKLDKTQLRSLIREAIQTRQPGSPLFSPPKRKRKLQETPLHPNLGAISTLVDDIKDSWMDMAEGDPSIQDGPGGYAGWEAQVDDACEELESAIEAVVDEIDNKLTQGEFFKGDQSPSAGAYGR